MNNIKQLAVLISVLSLSAGAGMADQPKHGGGGGHGGFGSSHRSSHGSSHGSSHHGSGGNVWVNSVLPSVIMSVFAPRSTVIVSPIVPMAPVYYSEPAPVYYNQPAPVICHTAPVYIAPRLVYDPYVSPVIIYTPERGYHYQYRQRLVNGSW